MSRETSQDRRAEELEFGAQRGLLLPYLRELSRHRELLMFLVVKNLKVQFAETLLGFGWLVLRPVLYLSAMAIVFGHLARMPSDDAPYVLFAFSGLLPWLYFAGTVSRGASSLSSNAALITKVYFPRLYLPLSQVIASLAEFAATLLVFFGVAWIGYGRTPGAAAAWLVPSTLLLIITTVAVALWLAALSVSYRDVRQLVGNLVQMLMFATPVIWPLSLISQRFGSPGEAFLEGYAWYPMVGVLEGFRHALLGTPSAPWDLLARGYASALLLLATGLLYFRSHEREFSDIA